MESHTLQCTVTLTGTRVKYNMFRVSTKDNHNHEIIMETGGEFVKYLDPNNAAMYYLNKYLETLTVSESDELFKFSQIHHETFKYATAMHKLMSTIGDDIVANFEVSLLPAMRRDNASFDNQFLVAVIMFAYLPAVIYCAERVEEDTHHEGMTKMQTAGMLRFIFEPLLTKYFGEQYNRALKEHRTTDATAIMNVAKTHNMNEDAVTRSIVCMSIFESALSLNRSTIPSETYAV